MSLPSGYIYVMRKDITRSSSPVPHPLNGLSDSPGLGTPRSEPTKSPRARFFGLSSSRKGTPRTARSVLPTSTSISESNGSSSVHPVALNRAVSEGVNQTGFVSVSDSINTADSVGGGNSSVNTGASVGGVASNAVEGVPAALVLNRATSDPVSAGISEKKPSRLISSLSSLAKSTSFRIYRERRAREERVIDSSADSDNNRALLRTSVEGSLLTSGSNSPSSPKKLSPIPGLSLSGQESQLSFENVVVELTDEDTKQLIKTAKAPRGILKRRIFLRFLLLFFSMSSQRSSSGILNPSVMNVKYWLFLLSIFGKLVYIRKAIFLAVVIVAIAFAATTSQGEIFIEKVSQLLSHTIMKV